MSSRHSSHGESPRGNRTPLSTSYHSQDPNLQQQYLHPEDVYRMDRESSYFAGTTGSYPHSRQGSSTSSPRHSDIPAYQRLPSQTHSPSSFDPYAYQPDDTDSFFSPPRRMTPPEEIRGISRHAGSQNCSRRDSPGEAKPEHEPRRYDEPSKGKGKEREYEQRGENKRKSSSSGRHEPGGNGSSRKATGPSNKLVSGVFIRY